jgi:tRNA A37 threonylcarbamoyladenosine synthetase subunit TsaC/SUA5/YrdC
MVRRDITSRFSSITSQVILVQTDTTVGFLSQDEKKLQSIKSRPSNKPFIKVFNSFQALKNDKRRVPNRFKNQVRRAKKTTFIVKNISFRVAPTSLFSAVLRNSAWNYSTSANKSGEHFSRDFCEEKADIIIENKHGLFEGDASKLYKINHAKRKRLR